MQRELEYREAIKHLLQAAQFLDILHRDVDYSFRHLATGVREIAATLPQIKDALDNDNGETQKY